VRTALGHRHQNLDHGWMRLGWQDLSEATDEIGLVARAVQFDRGRIDIEDANLTQQRRRRLRLLTKISAEIGDALSAKAVEFGQYRGAILLPQGNRRGFEQHAIARFAFARAILGHLAGRNVQPDGLIPLQIS